MSFIARSNKGRNSFAGFCASLIPMDPSRVESEHSITLSDRQGNVEDVWDINVESKAASGQHEAHRQAIPSSYF